MSKDSLPNALPQVQLQSLRTLLAIRQYGSAKIVAEKFGRTVSAITRQIQELEKQLGGTPLFQRHSRGMRLTDAGETYAQSVEQAVSLLDNALAEFDLNLSTRPEQVRVHISEALVDWYLLPVLNDFTSSHPKASVNVTISTAQQACRALASRATDFATMFGIDELFYLDKYPEIEVVRNIEYPLVAVVNLKHKLAARGSMTPGELLQSGWLALPPKTYSTRLHFGNILAKLEPKTVLDNFVEVSVNSFAALKRYAMLSQAIVILPALAVPTDERQKTLAVIKIEGAENERTSFSLCRHREYNFNPATEDLYRKLVEAFDEKTLDLL